MDTLRSGNCLLQQSRTLSQATRQALKTAEYGIWKTKAMRRERRLFSRCAFKNNVYKSHVLITIITDIKTNRRDKLKVHLYLSQIHKASFSPYQVLEIVLDAED